MAFRLLVAAVLGALITRAADVPSPMFSHQYVETLRGVDQLEDVDVVRLERRLAANPNDLPTRLKLMAYHLRGDRASQPADRAKRIQQVLWLIQHHPDSEILHSPFAHFLNTQLDSPDLQRAVALWDQAAKAQPRDSAIQWNAASFFQGLDPALHLRYLESTAAADPNHPFALRPLAHLYALSILDRGPLAQRSQAGLDASSNVWVLGNAAYMFQSLYNQSLQSPAPNKRAAELAEHYFVRAKALDPKLDRNVILPKLDLQAVAREREKTQQSQREWESRAKESVGQIRRLPPSAFPGLPASIVELLNARKCRVPQPSPRGTAKNVVHGEFLARGEQGWAVLCSVNNSTTLLAFGNERDTHPQVINTTNDRYSVTFTGKDVGYARELSPVSRENIMSHYRAYGGPKPPLIDHQGIDDSFDEKVSVIWYFHAGKWLKLQGAD